MTGPRAVAALILALTAGGAGVAHAQSPASERHAEISVELGGSGMIRRTTVYTAAGQAANLAADFGLDRLIGRGDGRRKRDVFARLARVWLVNLPIAALAQGSAHDAGHYARHAEFGARFARRKMEQWPWPIPIAISVEYAAEPASFDDALAQGLSVLGGGEQGSTFMKQRLKDQIYRRESAGYFDWMLLGYASLDYPIYAWADLGGGIRDQAGDFLQYAAVMTVRAPDHDFEHWESRLRRDAWLNLADFALWQAVGNVLRYVVTGEREAPNRTLSLGRVRFVPAAYATLSPLGPERGAEVHIVAASSLIRVNVRQMTTPRDQSLWGTGAALRSRDTRRVLPEGNFDIWQRPDKGPGFRLEVGTTRAVPIGGYPIDASLRVGYKTEGYLVDAPQRATVLASVSMAVRF